MYPTVFESVYDFGEGHVQIQDTIDGVQVLLAVQELDLLDCPRETVEEPASGRAVYFVELVDHYFVDELVGNERTLAHKRLDLSADLVVFVVDRGA